MKKLLLVVLMWMLLTGVSRAGFVVRTAADSEQTKDTVSIWQVH